MLSENFVFHVACYIDPYETQHKIFKENFFGLSSVAQWVAFVPAMHLQIRHRSLAAYSSPFRGRLGRGLHRVFHCYRAAIGQW